MEQSKRYESAEMLIAEEELLASSPERVYEWFNRLSNEKDYDHYSLRLDEILENKLLDRNDSLIDLAIARYGFYDDSVKRVFEKGLDVGSKALILSCLSNRSIGSRRYSFDHIPNCLFDDQEKMYAWLRVANNLEISTLFENETINDSIIESFLECGEVWNALDEDKQIAAFDGLYKNKRMSQEYDGYMDGLSEYLHNRMFGLAWSLVDKVPVDLRYASRLVRLYEVIVDKRYDFDSVNKAKRWMVKEEETDRKKIQLSYFEQLRFHIYKCDVNEKINGKDTDDLLKNEDIAYRCCIYQRFNLTIEQMNKAYEVDKLVSIYAMLENNRIWKNEEKRNELSKLCWDADSRYNDNYLDCANSFKYKKERLEKKYPSWFIENDDPIVFDEDLPVNMGRLTQTIESLSQKIFNLNLELLEQMIRVEKENKKKIDFLFVITGSILFILLWKII